jgi:D-alanine-D-alanine ligase-like ATP-grasp enzyme
MKADRVEEVLNGDADAIYFASRGDLHSACLVLAAKPFGVEIGALAPSNPRGRLWLRLGFKDRCAYFSTGRLVVGKADALPKDCELINGRVVPLIDDKRASKELFRVLGYPAPAGQFFQPTEDGEEEAVAWFHGLGRPACLKANIFGKGNYVYPALSTEDDIRHAFRVISASSSIIVAEEHFGGSAVRFFYVRPKVVAVRLDRPANVIGDGRSTIADLITVKNAEKKRRTGHIPIEIDADVLRRLDAQGLSLDHVLEQDRQLFLRAVSNGYKGGDSYDCRQILHPSYAQAIERMCNAIGGMIVSAVDTKILDLAQPASMDNFTILEANNRPGVVPYHFPWEGEPQDVSTPLVEALINLDGGRP